MPTIRRAAGTKPEVFIVESLRFEEEAGCAEGQVLSHILRLNGKEPHYYYIRTKQELERVAELFADSGYRYLHLSCHGCDEGLATTLDWITFEELGRILRPRLKKRRLFLSACEMATPELAGIILKDSGCYSVVGPTVEVGFSEAALLWASFYHLMFKEDPKVMKRDTIRRHTRGVSELFRVPLNVFVSSKSSAKGFTQTALQPKSGAPG